ncbi:MAG: hypothetical protein ACYST0_02140 [Planctomycetota bacterium]|jgi:hypothetical protein
MNANTSSIATVPFVLAAAASLPLPAQTTTTSPAGWDGREAPEVSTMLGGYPEARFQFLDGEVNGLAMKLSQLEMRADGQHAANQPARAWQRTLLFLAPCDFNNHSIWFANNATATPQLAFIGKVSWPAVKTTTVKPLAQWGGANGEYRFPFGAPYQKPKGKDLLVDFVFAQGSLVGANWSGFSAYLLDGFHESGSVRDWPTVFGSAACRDSSQTRAAICEVGMWTHRKQLPHPWADTVVAWLSTFFAAPSSPVIQAMGIGQSAGVPVGSCQSLYLATPQVFLSSKADASGTASIYLGAFPYQPSLAGARITAQAAYNDSITKRFALTLASETTVAKQPGPYSFKIVSYFKDSATGTQGSFADHQSIPVFRYRYQ